MRKSVNSNGCVVYRDEFGHNRRLSDIIDYLLTVKMGDGIDHINIKRKETEHGATY